MSGYSTIPALQDLLLEDSYILGANVSPHGVVFEVEFRLLESHRLWRPATPGDAYCARRGTLSFLEPRRVDWHFSGAPPSRDASGELDFGEIDDLVCVDDRYRLEGDIGVIEIVAGTMLVVFDGD